MTKALPTNPIRPVQPKNTGTTIETIRSNGHSVSFPYDEHADESPPNAAPLELHMELFKLLWVILA